MLKYSFIFNFFSQNGNLGEIFFQSGGELSSNILVKYNFLSDAVFSLFFQVHFPAGSQEKIPCGVFIQLQHAKVYSFNLKKPLALQFRTLYISRFIFDKVERVKQYHFLKNPVVIFFGPKICADTKAQSAIIL
jgi:hypothetical protein